MKRDRIDNLTDVISGIDEKYIDEVSKERELEMEDHQREKKRKRTVILRLAITAAACVAVVFAAKGAIAGLFGAGASNIKEEVNKVNEGDVTASPDSEVAMANTANDTDPEVPEQSDENSQYVKADFTAYHKAKPIVALKCPEVPELPSFNNILYDNQEEYNNYQWELSNWRTAQSERRSCGESLDISEDFYRDTALEFLSESDKNRIYSPVNLYLALAMLSETAGGDSRSELLELLGEEDIEGVRTNSRNLWLSHYRNDVASRTVLGNSIWLDKEFDYKKDCVKSLAENYYAECFSEKLSEASEKIKDWVNVKTGDFLKDAADEIEVPEYTTNMMIFSTLYFTGRWEDSFAEANTSQRIFHSAEGDITTDFMYQCSEYGPYYWGEDFGAVQLSFKKGGSMWFILPDEDKTIDDVLSSGEYLEMVKNGNTTYPKILWENQKSMIVKLHLPKFDISSDLDLKEGLQKLGVDDIFEVETADFSGITDDEAFLGKVRHAARVAIDEEGCTAAAFTEEALCGAARPPEEEIELVFDRPFIFVITSDVGEPLFIGTVYNP